MEYKRKYIGVVETYLAGTCDSISDFVIAFNKNDLFMRAKELIKENKKKRNNIYLHVYEFAGTRFRYQYPAGFIDAFKTIIESKDQYIYDRLLQIIDHNYYCYDSNMNLLESHVEDLYPVHGNIQLNLDIPLCENQCIGAVDSGVYYSYYPNQDDKINYDYKVLNENIYVCKLCAKYLPIPETYSGIISKVFICNDMISVINSINSEILGDAWQLYMPDKENVQDNTLLKIVDDHFTDIKFDVYNVYNDCYSRYSFNN